MNAVRNGRQRFSEQLEAISNRRRTVDVARRTGRVGDVAEWHPFTAE